MTECKAPYRTDHDGPDWMRLSGQRVSTVQDHGSRYSYKATRGGITHEAQGFKRLAAKMGVGYTTLRTRFHEGHYMGWILTREME